MDTTWIIIIASALALKAIILYRVRKDVKGLKKLKKDIRYNSYFRYKESVGRYSLLCSKLKEAGIPSRVIYFENGMVHVTGDQDAIEKLCDELNIVKYSHYFTNDFLPVSEGVPIKYTHSVYVEKNN